MPPLATVHQLLAKALEVTLVRSTVVDAGGELAKAGDPGPASRRMRCGHPPDGFADDLGGTQPEVSRQAVETAAVFLVQPRLDSRAHIAIV
jgi:hypothetical protein